MKQFLVIALVVGLGIFFFGGDPKNKPHKNYKESEASDIPWVPELQEGVCFRYPDAGPKTFMRITKRNENDKSYKLDMYMGTGHISDQHFVHFLGSNKAREGVTLQEAGIQIVSECPRQGEKANDFETKLKKAQGKSKNKKVASSNKVSK